MVVGRDSAERVGGIGDTTVNLREGSKIDTEIVGVRILIDCKDGTIEFVHEEVVRLSIKDAVNSSYRLSPLVEKSTRRLGKNVLRDSPRGGNGAVGTVGNILLRSVEGIAKVGEEKVKIMGLSGLCELAQ